MSKSRFLSRDNVLSADDLKTVEVEVTEWGGTLLVRALTGKEKDIFFGSFVNSKGETKLNALTNATARVVSLCVINEDGSSMFTRADVEALGNKNGKALGKVWEVVQDISGLSPKSIKALTENLDEGQTENSISH